MIFVYIIGGFIFIVLAVYLLDKREKMTRDIKLLKEKKNDIEAINKQLDDIQEQLNEIQTPLEKINHISTNILKYRK